MDEPHKSYLQARWECELLSKGGIKHGERGGRKMEGGRKTGIKKFQLHHLQRKK